MKMDCSAAGYMHFLADLRHPNTAHAQTRRVSIQNVSRSAVHKYHYTIHFNSYLFIVEDVINELYGRLGGVIECSDVRQRPVLLVNKIITDENASVGASPWCQLKTNPLPLLWTCCICGEIP